MKRQKTRTCLFLQVQTKTVSQCVEFYYTYKKQVKVARNGILIFGPPHSPAEKHAEAVVDVKVQSAKSLGVISEEDPLVLRGPTCVVIGPSLQQVRTTQAEVEDDDGQEGVFDEQRSHQARVAAQSLQVHDYVSQRKS